MALTAQQQKFLDTYIRKHSLKGKGKAKRAEAFSEAREQVMRLLKAQPWLLPEVPAYRVRFGDADSLGEALKFDRATAAMTQLLADMQLAVRARPKGNDPDMGQPGNPVLRTKLINDRDEIVNAADFGDLLKNSTISGDLKVLRARIGGLLERGVPTVAQLIEARGLVDELRVKADFARKRKAEVDKRRRQLARHAQQLKGSTDDKTQQLIVRATALAQKDTDQWTRADENEATSLYLDMMLSISQRDQIEQKDFKAGEDAIVLAVRSKYKTDDTGQTLKDEANFKLIVKPLSNEIEVPGFPAGGGAGREMMGSVIGDKLQEMLGIDLNVAKTRLVRVEGSQLKGDPQQGNGAQGKALPNGLVTSSVQAFVKGGKSVQDYSIEANAKKGIAKPGLTEQGEEARKFMNENVAKSEIQGKAVFDLIALHADRHHGNFMVDENKKLVPIDHGNVLPTRNGLRERFMEMGPPHAFLAETDAAQEKLAPEMIERVEKLNIDELINTMTAAHQEMARDLPDANVGGFEEGIANARRSAEFMKFAARQLTVAQIYNCYKNYFEDIFLSTEDDKLMGFAAAVAGITDDGSAAQKIETRFGSQTVKENRGKLIDALQELGWCLSRETPGTLMRGRTQRVLDILDRRLRAPELTMPATPPPIPTGDSAPKEADWNFYLALGGDAAAERMGIGQDIAIAGRMRILDARWVATGKLP